MPDYPLHAHPGPLWQVLLLEMQESPHALPLLQILQQVFVCLCGVAVGGTADSILSGAYPVSTTPSTVMLAEHQLSSQLVIERDEPRHTLAIESDSAEG